MDPLTCGRVGELWRYPVKSLQGERLKRVAIGPLGVKGDRALGVRDLATGAVLSAKKEEALVAAAARTINGAVTVEVPSKGAFEATDPALAGALCELLGRPVEVVEPVPGDRAMLASKSSQWESPPGAFVDSAPVHLVTSATLAYWRRRHPGTWDVRRFRPNVLVISDGDGDPSRVEERWLGARVSLGEVVLQVLRRCERCRMTTYAQPPLPEEDRAALEADKGILRTLAAGSDECLGVLAEVVEPGAVNAGDEVTVTWA